MQRLPVAVEPPLLQIQVITTRQLLLFPVLFGQIQERQRRGIHPGTGVPAQPLDLGLQEALPNSKTQAPLQQQGLT